MTEELDGLFETLENDLLSRYEYNLLLNYITNLQKENEKLKEIVENLTTMTANGDKKQIKNTAQYKLDIYKSRNEKAIEWCKCVVNAKYTADKLPNGKTTDMGYCLDLAEPLLNILQGGDE